MAAENQAHARIECLLEQLAQQLAALGVERGERLVEHPDPLSAARQAPEREPPALTGRQVTGLERRLIGKAHAREHRDWIGRR